MAGNSCRFLGLQLSVKGLGLHIGQRQCPAAEINVTRGHAEEILRIRAQIHFLLWAMHSTATKDQKPGFGLTDVMEDLFEGFASEELNFEADAIFLSHLRSALQMRLVDL